jgi:hypothetical protein
MQDTLAIVVMLPYAWRHYNEGKVFTHTKTQGWFY